MKISVVFEQFTSIKKVVLECLIPRYKFAFCSTIVSSPVLIRMISYINQFNTTTSCSFVDILTFEYGIPTLGISKS